MASPHETLLTLVVEARQAGDSDTADILWAVFQGELTHELAERVRRRARGRTKALRSQAKLAAVDLLARAERPAASVAEDVCGLLKIAGLVQPTEGLENRVATALEAERSTAPALARWGSLALDGEALFERVLAACGLTPRQISRAQEFEDKRLKRGSKRNVK